MNMKGRTQKKNQSDWWREGNLDCVCRDSKKFSLSLLSFSYISLWVTWTAQKVCIYTMDKGKKSQRNRGKEGKKDKNEMERQCRQCGRKEQNRNQRKWVRKEKNALRGYDTHTVGRILKRMFETHTERLIKENRQTPSKNERGERRSRENTDIECQKTRQKGRMREQWPVRDTNCPRPFSCLSVHSRAKHHIGNVLTTEQQREGREDKTTYREVK